MSEQFVVALDFDGTVCKPFTFPNMPTEVFPGINEWIQEGISRGHKVVIWTSRNSKYDDEIRKLLPGIVYINSNPYDILGEQSKKIYADFYIDDRCPWFPGEDWFKQLSWDILETKYKERENARREFIRKCSP